MKVNELPKEFIITALQDISGKRWIKNNMDRIYLNENALKQIGADMTQYNANDKFYWDVSKGEYGYRLTDYDYDYSDNILVACDTYLTATYEEHQAKKLTGIDTVDLSFSGYYPIPAKGNLMLYKGKVYKVISSKYYPEIDDDYEYMPAYTKAKADDVTNTPEGQALIADDKAKREKQQQLKALMRTVEKQGTRIERVNGQMVEQPEGKILYDSFTIYGSGERLIETDMEYWYLKNNGGDGDFWDWNTVSTGGAGAYGWILKKEAQVID